MPTEPQKDLVTEARELIVRTEKLRRRGREPQAVTLLRQLCDEVERLKRGDFTSEEFQNLCHNTDIQAGFDAFADGCETYQQKMFGRCRTKGKVL